MGEKWKLTCVMSCCSMWRICPGGRRSSASLVHNLLTFHLQVSMYLDLCLVAMVSSFACLFVLLTSPLC
jgi:hypothetical protein